VWEFTDLAFFCASASFVSNSYQTDDTKSATKPQAEPNYLFLNLLLNLGHPCLVALGFKLLLLL
jgi:hypothetical protein